MQNINNNSLTNIEIDEKIEEKEIKRGRKIFKALALPAIAAISYSILGKDTINKYYNFTKFLFISYEITSLYLLHLINKDIKTLKLQKNN